MTQLPYADIERNLANLPATMVPALLRVLVKRAIDAKVFAPGGLESFLRSQLDRSGNIERLRAVLESTFHTELGNQYPSRASYLDAFAHRLDAAGVSAR